MAATCAAAAWIALRSLGAIPPFVWSAVGQFHFFVMWSELSFLYVAMAVSINNWRVLRADLLAWRSYCIGWTALALFGLTLLGDVIRFSAV